MHMAKPLGRIAVGGLSVGVLSLALAYALGDNSMHRLLYIGTSFASSCSGGETAAGTATERHLKWGDGDAVDIALPATVHYRGGEGDEVIVRGPADVIAHVEIRGGRITLDCRTARLRDLDVTLPGLPFRRIGLSGSGKVLLDNLNQPDLSVHVAGSGDIRAQGKVDRMAVSITGSGHARLADLAVQEFTVKVTGSGNVEAAPTTLADVTISGAGNVRLLSHPAQVRSHITGSGRTTEASLRAADTKN
jgi:hypothetical protein